jgi:hypothetical protein
VHSFCDNLICSKETGEQQLAMAEAQVTALTAELAQVRAAAAAAAGAAAKDANATIAKVSHGSCSH